MLVRELPGLDLGTLLSTDAGNLTLTWLGQAGWILRTPDGTVVMDPYLSDSLAQKYAGSVYPHVREHPAPIDATDLHDVDIVTCSHRHTDHMDPETLRAIAAASPRAVFVVPAAWTERMVGFGLARGRIIPATDGTRIEIGAVTIDPVLAAHEAIERDGAGNSLYLGYVVTLGRVQVYHSGDCVPYPGQPDDLQAVGVDVAILPVNGRDATRRAHGVPGNFEPEEALRLAEEIGAKVVIASHFGMFDFNTVDQRRLDAATSAMDQAVSFVQPEPGTSYEVVNE